MRSFASYGVIFLLCLTGSLIAPSTAGGSLRSAGRLGQGAVMEPLEGVDDDVIWSECQSALALTDPPYSISTTLGSPKHKLRFWPIRGSISTDRTFLEQHGRWVGVIENVKPASGAGVRDVVWHLDPGQKGCVWVGRSQTNHVIRAVISTSQLSAWDIPVTYCSHTTPHTDDHVDLVSPKDCDYIIQSVGTDSLKLADVRASGDTTAIASALAPAIASVPWFTCADEGCCKIKP